jgi:hypothetical protein
MQTGGSILVGLLAVSTACSRREDVGESGSGPAARRTNGAGAHTSSYAPLPTPTGDSTFREKSTQIVVQEDTSSHLYRALLRGVVVERDGERGYVLRVKGLGLLAAFDAFEAAGSYGNGPAWAELAEYLIASTPAIAGMSIDEESDAFLAYARSRVALDTLRELLIETVADSASLGEAVASAREALGHGDL